MMKSLPLVKPSSSFIDDLDGWAATMIDALDTMLIMGIDDGIFTEAIAAVSTIDFTKAKTSDLASVLNRLSVILEAL